MQLFSGSSQTAVNNVTGVGVNVPATINVTRFYPPGNIRATAPMQLFVTNDSYGVPGMLDPRDAIYAGNPAEYSEWDINGTTWIALNITGLYLPCLYRKSIP